MSVRKHENRKAQYKGENQVERLPVFGPWGGLIPPNINLPNGTAVDSSLLTPQSAIAVDGFVPRGEALTADYGWYPIKGDQQPLPAYTAGAAVAAVAAGCPVMAIIYLHADVSPNVQPENLVVTAASALGNGNLWTLPKYDATITWWGNTLTAGSTAITTDYRTPIDHAIYLPGHTVLFCNGVGSNFAGEVAGNLYWYTGRGWEEFAIPTGVTVHTFGCVSVCAHQDRVLIINTRESSVRYPNRIRWTRAGWSTALASPLTAPTGAVWNDPGAGLLDVEEQVGAGVCIRELGNHVVAYFETGVVLLERTGNVTRPYQRRVLTTKRGLMATRAVTNTGNATHFGIFSDGWFFLNENGEWQEAGISQVGTTNIRKWSQQFYERINDAYAFMTAVQYDPSTHFIRIAWPDGPSATTLNRVWIYDVYGDRVWQDDSYNQATFAPQSISCWGENIEYTPAVVMGAWDTLTPPWDDHPDIWDVGVAHTGRVLRAHGTTYGFVHQHDDLLITRQQRSGDTPFYPSFTYETPPLAMGDPSQWKQLQQFVLHYAKVQSATVIVTVELIDGTTDTLLASQSITLHNDANRVPDVQNAWFRTPFVQLRVRLSGTHPFVLRGFELGWLPDMGDVRQ